MCLKTPDLRLLQDYLRVVDSGANPELFFTLHIYTYTHFWPFSRQNMCKCVLRFCKKWSTRPPMGGGLFTFTQMKKVRSPIYHPSTSQRAQATCPPNSTRASSLHFELVLSPPILPFLFSVMATQTPRGRAYTDSEVDSLYPFQWMTWKYDDDFTSFRV